MHVSEVTEGIHQLSVSMYDTLFEGLWEIPRGVSINSYIVKGEKTALIDGVCGWDGVPESLFEMLDSLDVVLDDVDYLIINHMEPDHSGWLANLRALKNDLKIVCTKASEQLLEAFYAHVDDVVVVKDGDTLDLGKGRVLEFVTMPNVHWPDTMVTYDRQSGTLLSCDVFGSYGAIEGLYYDEQLKPNQVEIFEEETARYFANIISAFTEFARKGVDKLTGYELNIIAPGHGLVWRQNPEKILKAYQTYIQYQHLPNTNEVTLVYGSMYGMTESAATFIRKVLEGYNVKVHVHKVPETSWGMILSSAWTSSAIIIGMPTYEYKMFPPMAALLEELGRKKVKDRWAFRFGSYGWSGGAQKDLEDIMDREQMNWHFVEPVEFKGAATTEDFLRIETQIQILLEHIGLADEGNKAVVNQS